MYIYTYIYIYIHKFACIYIYILAVVLVVPVTRFPGDPLAVFLRGFACVSPKLGRLWSSGPGQFFGSYVVNRVLTIRLVQ